MRTATLQVQRPQVAAEKLGYFRFGRVAGKVILTNDAGEWHFLDEAGFRTFLRGEIGPGHPQYEPLQARGFLRQDLDLEGLAERVRRKKRFLGVGPHLHVVIATLRCNQSCRYCHASRTSMDRVDTDMSLETAKKAVDHAFTSTSPYIAFEYQGGEPTINLPVIQFCVEYSREKNRYENKILDHSLVSNFTWMTEEKADWLVENGVLVCTSLDGPQDVHNFNRTWLGEGSGNAWQNVLTWMKRFNEGYIRQGLDPELWHVDALMTTTRKSLSRAREIVDLYVDLGIRNIHLRPLNPFGFAMGTWKSIGYSMEEYLEFYTEALDYILELNLQGVQIIEGTASTFLKKILTPDDPNFVDIRSPIGAGTGQVAYNYDGTIYPSDEARMISAMGDDLFAVGTLGATTYEDTLAHPTTRTLAVASLCDALPQCSTCWNAPWCGVRPLHNFMQSGDLFGQRPLTPKCKEHMRIVELLFDRMTNDPTGRIETIFRRWTILRPRES